ncbi:MAG: ethanolamine utilization protein EutN [Bacteroidia bacterium]|nr:MAG: ethanolamine utilization protein EutN [Bacteroidia bacterium]
MLIGKVISNIWATRKDEKLRGLKLMVVEIEGEKNRIIVAADYIGAGEGDRVIITTGSSARRAFSDDTPIDSTIVGIIDSLELEKE